MRRKCTPTAATGGWAQGPSRQQDGQTSGTLNVKVTWAQHKGTTKATDPFRRRRRPVGSARSAAPRIKITGKVTGGTGTAFKTIKKNQPVTGSVCLKTVGHQDSSLEPGTVIKF